jgi:hypothetical protein
MPNKNTGTPILDAARLPRSFVEVMGLLDRALSASTVFCPGHQVGFATNPNNPYLFLKDANAKECVVGCYSCQNYWLASYDIKANDTVAFGKASRVKEEFVPVDGEVITDAVALEDEGVEVLDSGTGKTRVRILSTRANTVINKRAYSMAALREAVVALKKQIGLGLVYSETPHPKPIKKDGKVIGFERNEAQRASRLVDATINDRGEVHVTHEFLETAIGKEVGESFTSRSGKYGTSSRGIGSKKTVLASRNVPLFNALKLETFDFVPNPALSESLSAFDVILDSELPDEEPTIATPTQAPAPEQGVVILDTSHTRAALAVASEKEINTVPEPTQQAAANNPAATITPEQLAAFNKTLADAQSVIQADAARKGAETLRVAIKAHVATEAPAFLQGIPEQFHAKIVTKAEAAESIEAAIAVLSDESDTVSTMLSIANLKAQGLTGASPAQGVTTPTAGSPTVDVKVISNPTPHLEVARRMGEAHDAYMRKTENFIADPVLREHNKAFVEQLTASAEAKSGGALVSSAEAILDSAEGWDVITDSTTTSNLWNQPTIATMLLRLVYQDLAMTQFCGGIGPKAFEKTTVNGQIGSVLRVPTKVYIEPTGSLALPGYDSSLFSSGEDLGIPPASVQTSWQTFFPQWRKVALIVTKEVQTAMKHGPLNFDVMAELSSDMIADMKRRIDRALAEEMIASANEYAAVAVASEATIAGNLISNTTTPAYGATVTFYAKLIGAGTSGAPAMPPVLRRRATADLSSSGQFSTAIKYAVAITGAATTQVEGYLDAAGNINAIPGVVGTVTFAVDYENGIVVFNAASGIIATALPTIAYNYATNYDIFHLTPAAGVEPAYWYNRLITQIDATAAGMGSFPKFSRPNLVLGSLTAMNYVANAQIFYELASPKGTTLIPGTSDRVAERSGLNFARHNTPWSAGDASLLLTRVGATRLGVDSPMELEGPFPTYDSSGNVKSTKTVHATDNSVICTPQPVDQNGATRNPVARRILLRP